MYLLTSVLNYLSLIFNINSLILNLDQPVIEFINNTFRMLNELIDDKTCSGIGRDCCLDLVVKFVDRANGCSWTSKFIVSGIYHN
jgi:hypothetical protein